MFPPNQNLEVLGVVFLEESDHFQQNPTYPPDIDPRSKLRGIFFLEKS